MNRLTLSVRLGVFSVTLLPTAVFSQDSAEVVRAKQDIRSLVTVINLFKFDNARVPTNDEGLAVLVASPTNSGRGARLPRSPQDPWGRPYLYVVPGRVGAYDVYTLGADGREGGEGDDADLGSWMLDGALKWPPR